MALDEFYWERQYVHKMSRQARIYARVRMHAYERWRGTARYLRGNHPYYFGNFLLWVRDQKPPQTHDLYASDDPCMGPEFKELRLRERLRDLSKQLDKLIKETT